MKEVIFCYMGRLYRAGKEKVTGHQVFFGKDLNRVRFLKEFFFSTGNVVEYILHSPLSIKSFRYWPLNRRLWQG